MHSCKLRQEMIADKWPAWGLPLTIREGSRILDRATLLMVVQSNPSCLLKCSPKRLFVFKCAASAPNSMGFLSGNGTSKACEKVLHKCLVPAFQRRCK